MKFKIAHQPTERIRVAPGKESLTHQSFKKSTDINYILSRYKKTGVMEGTINAAQPTYSDVTEMNDYQESLNTVIAAQNSFMELPAQVRKDFNNDPGQFIEFAQNPENHDQMIEMGLLPENHEPEPITVRFEEGSKPQTTPQNSTQTTPEPT